MAYSLSLNTNKCHACDYLFFRGNDDDPSHIFYDFLRGTNDSSETFIYQLKGFSHSLSYGKKYPLSDKSNLLSFVRQALRKKIPFNE